MERCTVFLNTVKIYIPSPSNPIHIPILQPQSKSHFFNIYIINTDSKRNMERQRNWISQNYFGKHVQNGRALRLTISLQSSIEHSIRKKLFV